MAIFTQNDEYVYHPQVALASLTNPGQKDARRGNHQHDIKGEQWPYKNVYQTGEKN